MAMLLPSDEAEKLYNSTRRTHWDSIARKRAGWSMGQWYHHRLIEIYQFLTNPNQRVLEIGCGMGDLVAQLRPSYGVGVDFSPEMIAHARDRHPQLEFHQMDAHDLSALEGPFDTIIFLEKY